MMMSMHFTASSRVTLLFEFWDVNGPAGMVVSVLVVLLMTVFYELLKIWKVSLDSRSKPPSLPDSSSRTTLVETLSGSSVPPAPPQHSSSNKRWLLFHVLQTALHVVQVVLSYMLMLCIMSYSVWIFLGVVMGSAIGYFVAYPLLTRV
ncbi:putative low affinity copper uptake protein 2 isoform X1 [Acipenser oxyrinchus oxyrinchus]|uniref:Copper transport protein n=1 Tax=Acipenser oxyrinchus oxyrinchus TaxID=40147 RepID=A0AAD8CQY8_ACIOX|nr:putative low affinity copper uptake protein 2 isoform X1 [Acipenser oxyrinchus oxyrinchus]